MPLAVVDIGTNSTRLLIGEVEDGRAPLELLRRSQVTRLGEGVDATGRLSPAALERTEAVLATYAQLISEYRCAANRAILTSAVRDAAAGQAFVERVRERFGLDAAVLSGEEEALLTRTGARASRSPAGPVAVVDIGGGSTEFVIGRRNQILYHRSLQAGVVRMSERHLHHDPPLAEELAALRADVRRTFAEGLADAPNEPLEEAIAVAGTATSAAAILQRLVPYDPSRVEGYVVSLDDVERLSRELAALPLNDRRRVPGLHPDRAPTIIAGMVLLAEALRRLGIDRFTASEHDILYGALLELHNRIAQKRPSIEHSSRR